MSDVVLPPEEFSAIAVRKMEQRQRGMEDIASGRRTPEEVQRDNSWLIPYPEECVPLNLLKPVKSFELGDYSALLAAIESPDLDLILVGGHAAQYTRIATVEAVLP